MRDLAQGQTYQSMSATYWKRGGSTSAYCTQVDGDVSRCRCLSTMPKVLKNDDLISHQDQVHPLFTSDYCRICGYGFKVKSQLWRHHCVPLSTAHPGVPG